MQKRIFVSGASKGIGLAIALRFASQGFNVAISARNQDSLTSIQQNHPNIQIFRADMANKTEVENLARWLNESFGPLDVLVNNVGRFIPGQMHTESDELFEELMRTNLYSNYYLTKRVLPSMMDRKSGTIFNICSIASLIAYPNSGAYSI